MDDEKKEYHPAINLLENKNALQYVKHDLEIMISNTNEIMENHKKQILKCEGFIEVCNKELEFVENLMTKIKMEVKKNGN